ncbi:ABC transporter ATP-binding protein [Ruminiclostridium cellulolyticum]|uniref:ABC transporter related n=1 Tax=Ruminiclostridium cellulolyticum (strain ATCC 35319 / DSM 5812 / JCM 6584 / H10) TaxID=394503 RepID=B8I530_RUMCH|nr:ABC transporter ATP-binding protein [Ruminiclostridium cellulolyticum]ACL74610.1 ABC transporter related [Ruminiclostridium cellulolyticum H10]
MNNDIEIRNLCKNFDSFKLNDISFSLPQGYIMGLVGPNGAGKTTTIKLMLNMIQKTSGDIKILGLDSVTDQNRIKESIGAVFDTNYFVQDWTVNEVERYIGMFYDTWDSAKYKSLTNKFGLNSDKKVKDLSRGMQMKLMVSCALSHDARLLILDEPTSGLDPVAREELLDIMTEFIGDGKSSVLFSTHITSDLDKIADYITFINQGSLFYTGTKDDFIDGFRIVKGGKNDITREQEGKMIGIRKYSTGFEGLIKTEDLRYFVTLACEPVSIDDIIVFTNRGGKCND